VGVGFLVLGKRSAKNALVACVYRGSEFGMQRGGTSCVRRDALGMQEGDGTYLGSFDALCRQADLLSGGNVRREMYL
jgi:hypothetical protein